jgi:histidinol phosphatase-like enzyme
MPTKRDTAPAFLGSERLTTTMKDSRATVFRTVVILVILFVVGGIAYGRYQEKNAANDPRYALAQCLTDKGVKFYGAYWCPHCQQQKKLFGGAMKNVTYVECAVPGDGGQTQACKDAGIESYPTWVFPDGSKTTGEQQLKDLGDKVGCEYSGK